MNAGGFGGRCLCGQFRFRVHADPVWVGYCHCESCRRSTGAAVATFVGVAAEHFEITAGTRAHYESSPGVRRSFCPTCGTPLSYEGERFPGEVHLYVSVLDEPGKFEPQFHVYCAEALAWLAIDDDLPRFEATTGGASAARRRD